VANSNFVDVSALSSQSVEDQRAKDVPTVIVFKKQEISPPGAPLAALLL